MTISSSLFSSCFPWTAQNARGKHFQRRKIFGRKCELSLFFFFPVFLGLHQGHMEVPRLGIELALQLPIYSTATAILDP